MPLDTFLTSAALADFRDAFLLTSLGSREGKQYFIPRKFETRIMVYQKSKVADALKSWQQYRGDIDSAMAQYNGYGLPAHYQLEEDPESWDFFDIFVLGWIWAHRAYDGVVGPRIAHRGKRYSGTSQRIIDRVFQCGGDSAAVVGMQGDAVTDAIHWESLYAASGVYNPAMWEKKWGGAEIWKGFGDNDVFLAFMTQLDCFFIHGTGRDSLEGFLDDPGDLGVATMPRGCSAILDAAGQPLRTGSKTVTTGGWWWAIPANAPNPAASFKAAMFIVGTANQIQECSRFGMIPVRKDVLSDITMLFGGGWVTEIYTVSFRQLMHNKTNVLPAHKNFDLIQEAYLDVWDDVIIRHNWSDGGRVPDRSFIQKRIENIFAARMSTIR